LLDSDPLALGSAALGANVTNTFLIRLTSQMVAAMVVVATAIEVWNLVPALPIDRLHSLPLAAGRTLDARIAGGVVFGVDRHVSALLGLQIKGCRGCQWVRLGLHAMPVPAPIEYVVDESINFVHAASNAGRGWVCGYLSAGSWIPELGSKRRKCVERHEVVRPFMIGGQKLNEPTELMVGGWECDSFNGKNRLDQFFGRLLQVKGSISGKSGILQKLSR
jgi:hypothetical protein